MYGNGASAKFCAIIERIVVTGSPGGVADASLSAYSFFN
jgi:hypothetical protein